MASNSLAPLDSQRTLVNALGIDTAPDNGAGTAHATPENESMETVPVATDDEDAADALGGPPIHPPGLPIPQHLPMQTPPPNQLQLQANQAVLATAHALPPPATIVQQPATANVQQPAAANVQQLLAAANPPPPVANHQQPPLVQAQWQMPVQVHVPPPRRAPLTDVSLNRLTGSRATHGINNAHASLLQNVVGGAMSSAQNAQTLAQNGTQAATAPLHPGSPAALLPPLPIDASPTNLDLYLPRGVADSGGTANANARRTHQVRAPSARRSATATSDDLYWRHVESPPVPQDPLFWPSGQNPQAQQQFNRGEHSVDVPFLNSYPNDKKRPWVGSPDPEDMQRQLSRLRMTGTTPLLRGARTLPRSLSAVSNPWECEQRGRGVRVDEGISFLPVASSTPEVSTVLPGDQSQSPSPFVNTSGQPPTPHNVDDTITSAPLNETMSLPTASPEKQGRSQGRHRPMEVDPESEEDGSQDQEPRTPVRPTRGKGKARAVTQDVSDGEQALASDQDEGWNEDAIAQAQQESLRQAQEDRIRLYYGEGRGYQRRDGPSGSRVTDAWRSPGYGTAAGPSGVRTMDGDPATHMGFETSEWRIPPQRRQTHGTGDRASQRERSEFRPFPNTRAAAFVDQRDRNRATNAATRSSVLQRSPLTRAAGMQNIHPGLSAYSRPSAAPGERDDAGSERRVRQERDNDVSERRERHERVRRDRGDDRNASQRAGSRVQTGDVPHDVHEAEELNPAWYAPEDGEVIPTAIEDGLAHNDAPTGVPTGGFPRIYRDDPEARIRGMAVEWIQEIWSDRPNTVVLLDIYNYRHTEDDSYNRRISEAIRGRFEQLTGEQDFDVVPPKADPATNLRSRNLPTTWAIRGLSPGAVATATRQGVWSFNDISFFAFPRAAQMTSWICMLEGFLDGNEAKIRAAILRVLNEDGMNSWLASMVATNPDFLDGTVDEGVQAILDSVRVEPMQMGNGNYVVNVYIRPPTRDIREWRRWAADLRSRRYRSFANGTGRVRQATQCSGCHGVSHPTHICPYPRLRGWNGPMQGEGVFGERARGYDENDPSSGATRTETGPTWRRNESNRGRDNWSTPRPSGGRSGYNGGSGRGRGGGPSGGYERGRGRGPNRGQGGGSFSKGKRI
ncbi:hypothetical protein OH76DRAFT_1420964 [Lentinus brumalis]|uniref:Uncharacterized protein n=1 Tax=Lentinus brumalis TaxID=2498619 RepID=A0A371CXQ2_9APHY|nr:hypothetical protein OH76DRAFT_1420964 [Polyporus brumalis]